MEHSKFKSPSSFFYRSWYVTKTAVTAPQNESTAAATMTATVEVAAMTEPIVRDRMNWARKTMEDTMPTSVPMPRIWSWAAAA